jgi:archaellum component FlaC
VTPPEVKIPEILIPDYKADFERLGGFLDAIAKEIGRIPKESVKMPEIKDYSEILGSLSKEVSGIKAEVDRVPKEQKEYKPNFDNMVSMLNIMQSSLAKSFDDKARDLREQILKVQGIFARFDGLISRINELRNRVASLDLNDKEIMKAKEAISREVKEIQKMLDPVYQSKRESRKMILMSMGHKLNG